MSTPRPIIRLACLSLFLLLEGAFSLDYKAALSKTLIFYEAQRSGKLPPTQRVHWRGDSALKDGSDNGVDLTGGYYDAGDHVKFGLPLSYTISMLAWGVVEFGTKLKASGEYVHALEAIRWGTDYLIKAHPSPNVLYGQVGEGGPDHDCWMRPEDMTTPRTSFKIDEQHPGADLAGETAAAFAAAARVFRKVDPAYSVLLLTHAKQLFTFAVAHPGLYQTSISQAGGFYSSSGYQDEVAWAAVWLHRVTNDTQYLQYLSGQGNPGGVRSMFSWDDKYVGVQTLVARLVLRGILENSGVWGQYKSQAEQFICSCLEKGNSNAKKSPEGMLWFNDWANLQYVTSASFIASAYSKYLKPKQASIQCPGGIATSADLNKLIKSQADYILGSNPSGQSFMVGFGQNYPLKVHHRGASIPSTMSVSCKGGFDYFNTNNANPNVLEGAIVGGPNTNDQFTDARSNYQQAEPGIATNAPFLGVLACLV